MQVEVKESYIIIVRYNISGKVIKMIETSFFCFLDWLQGAEAGDNSQWTVAANGSSYKPTLAYAAFSSIGVHALVLL